MASVSSWPLAFTVCSFLLGCGLSTGALAHAVRDAHFAHLPPVLITYMAAGTLYILLAQTGLQLYTACSQLGCSRTIGAESYSWRRQSLAALGVVVTLKHLPPLKAYPLPPYVPVWTCDGYTVPTFSVMRYPLPVDVLATCTYPLGRGRLLHRPVSRTGSISPLD